MIIAAADGSSLSNPGPAGWAWYVDDDRWAAGGWARGTNNMGELMAVLDLLEQTADDPQELTVLCDSQYVINSLTKWLPGWKRKGWRKADGSPVLNVDLLKDLDRALHGRKVTFEWVKGHAGHTMNEAADVRARAAATAYKDGTPVDRGPGYRPGRAPQKPPSKTYAPPKPAEDLFTEPDPEEHPAVALQRSLWDADVRGSQVRMDALLHPKFALHDAKGRVAGKGRTIAGSSQPLAVEPDLELIGVEELAPWVVLVRYRERTPTQVTLKASVWMKNGDDWRLRFEQATPII